MKSKTLFLICSLFLVQELTAGAWTLPKGSLTLKTALFYQKTSERYVSSGLFCGERVCENGERAAYFFNGQIESRAVYLDVRYGLLDRLQLQFQLPYFDIAFRDDVNPMRPSTADFGDLRVGAKYKLVTQPLVTTVGFELKAPLGFFNNDAEVVASGDGQWDLEFYGEVSRSFWPIPLYLGLDLGYRFRFDPDLDVTNIAPGDEIRFRLESGYNVTSAFLLKVALSGFLGKEFSAILPDSRLKLADSQRKILYFEPGVYWLLRDPLALDLTVKISLAGQNHPAGAIYGIGFSYRLPSL